MAQSESKGLRAKETREEIWTSGQELRFLVKKLLMEVLESKSQQACSSAIAGWSHAVLRCKKIKSTSCSSLSTLPANHVVLKHTVELPHLRDGSCLWENPHRNALNPSPDDPNSVTSTCSINHSLAQWINHQIKFQKAHWFYSSSYTKH